MGHYLLYLPLAYLAVFAVFSILKSLHPTLNNLIFCSTCFTYATVLVLAIFIGLTEFYLITFMLGMSVTGIAEKILEHRKYNQFLVQIVMTILGLMAIFLLSKVI